MQRMGITEIKYSKISKVKTLIKKTAPSGDISLVNNTSKRSQEGQNYFVEGYPYTSGSEWDH